MTASSYGIEMPEAPNTGHAHNVIERATKLVGVGTTKSTYQWRPHHAGLTSSYRLLVGNKGIHYIYIYIGITFLHPLPLLTTSKFLTGKP